MVAFADPQTIDDGLDFDGYLPSATPPPLPSTAQYLPLTGGTLSGPLTLAANPVAALQAATRQYVDSMDAAGVVSWNTRTGVVVMTGPDITGAGGAMAAGPQTHSGAHTFSGTLTAAAATVSTLLTTGAGTTTVKVGLSANGYPSVTFDHPTGGTASNWMYGYVNGKNRWAIELGDATPETGSNAGSNFVITKFSDAGSSPSSALVIERATGAMRLSKSLAIRTGVFADPAYDLDVEGDVQARTYIVSGNQVISDAVFGWGTPSNGVRGSFDANTATPLQTAQRLAQLIADLQEHGLINT